MRLTHLNLAAVRDSCRPSQPEEREDLTVSRRQMLGMTGAMAVVSAPALTMLERFGAGIEVRGDAHRVIFLLDGKERWVIDTRRFAGRPSLSLERREGFVRVTLNGARYPGTQIPADLVVEVRNGMLSPRLSLRMALGNFKAEGSAEKFLAGTGPLRSAVALGRSAVRVAPGHSLSLSGTMQAQFRADWTLTLRCNQPAVLTTPTGGLPSGVVVIALLDKGHPSAFMKVPSGRTRITLRRGDLVWKLSSLLPTKIAQHGPTPGGQLSGSFDQLHLELAETRSALIAEANGDHAAISYTPDGCLLGMEDEPFTYLLQAPRYVRVFHGSTSAPEWALVARFHSDPVWLRTEGFALEVSGGPGAALFEYTGKGQKTQLAYAPALLRMMTPVTGSITEPVAVKEGTTLRLHHSRMRPKSTEDVVHVRTHPAKPNIHELATANLVVSLLRARDLMVLRLEYVGYNLQVGGGKPPRLVRASLKVGALIAHFPPQHIQEEAYYEVPPGQPPIGPGIKPPFPGDDPLPATPGAVQTRLANESRLAFKIPSQRSEINYAVKDLLNWTGFTPLIAANAYSQQYFTKNQPSSSLTPGVPDDYTTAIEAPYRLMMSPNETSGWVHAGDDAETTFSDGVTELWHTRMGVVVNNAVDETGNTDIRTMRAIWSPDFKSDPSAIQPPYSGPDVYDPFRPSLDTHDRDNLVHLTSNFGLLADGFTPLPVNVERLMLSSLGAWMSVHGVWEPVFPVPGDLDVVAWRHIMTMGRDQYVKVAYRGFMYPFGNKAALIKVTDREFVTNPDTGRSDAILIQKNFVIIRQPELTFNYSSDQAQSDYPNSWMGATAADPGAWGGRKMPFKKVTIKTLATPPLYDPNTDPTDADALSVPLKNKNTNTTQNPSLGQYAFWPRWNSGGTPADVIWHCEAVDWQGQTSAFATPLLFLGSEVATPQEPITLVNPSNPPNSAPYENAHFEALHGVQAAYAADPRSTIQMNSQKVALAQQSPYPNPTRPSTVSDPSHETLTMKWTADLVPSSIEPLPPNIASRPWFYPVLARADIVIPAVKHMMGTTAPQQVTINKTYIEHALNLDGGGNPTGTIQNAVNKGQIFLDLVSPQALTFGGTQSNGTRVSPTVGQPNISIQSISALFGTVGDGGDNFAKNGFDPSKFFPTSMPDPQNPPPFDPLSTIILGFFTLRDILKLVDLSDLAKTPQMITQYLPTPESPTSIHVGYDWSTDLNDFLIFKANQFEPPHTKATLGFHISADVPIPQSPGVPTPSFHIEGGIYNFYLDFGILKLPFTHLIFTEDDGKKPDTDCKVGDVVFTGFLSFINELSKFMNRFTGNNTDARTISTSRVKALDSGSDTGDGPFLDVTDQGITAGFHLSIPDITLGVMSIQNIALGAEVIVPFIANPIQLNFNFCTRENPFILTVEIFGGGGFVSIGLQPQGFSNFEAMFEGGVNFDLDLGVASGSVSAMLGFYMKLDFLPHPGSGSLTGFVDIKGSVDVLGLISASIEIYLALTWETPGNKLAGEASIKVDVHVLFFSTTVTLGPVRKEFAGGGSAFSHDSLRPRLSAAGPAKISDLLTKPEWQAYCQAFA